MKFGFFLLFLTFSIFLLGISTAVCQLDGRLENSHPTKRIEKPRAVPWCGPEAPASNLRQGGDDIDTAFLIPSLPFVDSGTTCGYNYDNAEICPYFSQGPDVVYTFTPGSDMVITVDMCGSSYDTFIWVWDDQMWQIACNDDYYYGIDPCGTNVSKIEQAHLQQGVTYYIFVAGYAGCGDYQMTISEYEPCVLDCAGVIEGEPALHDGYVDDFNSGCLMPSSPFQSLEGDQNGDLVFCGKSGWYEGVGGEDSVDTDWFFITIGSTGVVEWILEAEEITKGFLIGPQDCSEFSILESNIANICTQPSLILEGSPGGVLWLAVTPYSNLPPGFVGHEYNYICTFTGLASGTVATEALPWGQVKSLYR